MGKLTEEQKKEAYRLYTEEKYTYSKISQKMEVSVQTIVRAVSEQEKAHKADDLTQAPLACDLITGDQSGKPATPQSVVDAVSVAIALIAAEIGKHEQSIKEQQREVDVMRSRLAELRKWKDEQAC